MYLNGFKEQYNPHLSYILRHRGEVLLTYTYFTHYGHTIVTAVELTPVQRSLSGTKLDFTCRVLSVL